MTMRGSCHCGAHKIEITTEPERATRCTCTFCTKRGALWAYVTPESFRIVSSPGTLSLYSPTNRENLHYFCSKCGCATHSDTPDWAAQETAPGSRRIAVSVHLLEEVDIQAIPVDWVDGRNLW